MANPSAYYLAFHTKDPGAPVECAQPDTPAPFRREEVWLKQTDPAELNETGQLILRAFGGFFERLTKNRAAIAAERESALAALVPTLAAKFQYMSEPAPNRRFAGDWQLPRTRYYSLCHSGEGDDDGTMERELLDYHEPATHGWIEINDVTSKGLSNFRQGYVISIPSITRAKLYPELPGVGPHDLIDIIMPVKVQRRLFEKLIDLRIPSVAAWFTRNLTRIEWGASGGGVRAFLAKGPLDTFDQILPSLFVQTHGGGECATRIAGQWLRILGADALIFPSARSDAFVEVADDTVVRWGGWNLVDYTGAPPLRTFSCDLTSTWLSHLALEVNEPQSPLYRSICFDTVHSGPHAGSWGVKNLQTYRTAFRMSQTVLYVYSSAQEVSSRQRELLLQLLLQDGSSASIMRNSSAMLRALLGNHELRDRICRHIAHSAPDVAHELQLELVFGGMDKLLNDTQVSPPS
jgi:hypothetical protein